MRVVIEPTIQCVLIVFTVLFLLCVFTFQTSLFAWCFLPASSQTFVERDDDQLLIALRSGEVQLRGKKLLLRLQHFVVVGLASEVTLSGKLHRFFQRSDLCRLLVTNFRQSLARDQCVGNVAKSER